MTNSFLHPADTKNPKLLKWLCKEEIRYADKTLTKLNATFCVLCSLTFYVCKWFLNLPGFSSCFRAFVIFVPFPCVLKLVLPSLLRHAIEAIFTLLPLKFEVFHISGYTAFFMGVTLDISKCTICPNWHVHVVIFIDMYPCTPSNPNP